MVPYRRPVISQDLDGCTLYKHSRSIPSSVLKDVTNKSFPFLHLSEETLADTLHQGNEDFNLGDRSGNRTYGLEFLQPKVLPLQLLLSQSQMTIDQNLKCEAHSQLDGNTIPLSISSEPFQLPKNLQAAVNSNEVFVAQRPVSPAASQSTGSKELPLPRGQQSNPIRGNSRISADSTSQFHGKRSAEKSLATIRERKKLKSKKTKGLDEDIQAAIGLTVATAETLVIADIMNACQTCQSLGPKAILDAALVLRRERDALGLNHFSLEGPQGKSLPDLNWEEDLDDIILEAECYGKLPADLMGKGPCGDTSVLADMQSSKSLVKTEMALTTLKSFEANTGNTTAWHSQVQCEEGCIKENEVVQGITHMSPVLDDKRDEGVTSQVAQLVATKDSFNSRWFGGWTGVNCAKDKQACCNQWQAAKRHEHYLKFETSELSETCDLAPPAENLLKSFNYLQTKNPNGAFTSIPEANVEALSAGSCAEILLALSQASIKCSLQEPLCSFVPCSVNAKLKSFSTEPAGDNGAEPSDELTRKPTGLSLNGLSPGDDHNMSNEPHVMLETSPTRGTKRIHLNSLKRYSTISSMFEGTLQSTENDYPKQDEDKGELPLNANSYETDRTFKADGSTVPPNKSAECELILEDSALLDSPPLIWHRGKRRRLRACRVAESDMTLADSLSGSPPVVGLATAKCCSEPEIMNIEDCEGLRKSRKDEVQLLSRGIHHPTLTVEPGVLEEQHLKMNKTGQTHMEKLEIINTKQKVYNRRDRSRTSSQLFKGVRFLVTGFPVSQKNISEEVCKKIREHGGVIMSSIPSFSNLNQQRAPQKPHSSTCSSIVIALRKVRTLKYLYGCAAGLLIVRPNWVNEMILKKGLLSKHKERSKDLIFSRIAAYVHGQRSYCLKLSLLIQHGAGKVVKSMKSLVQLNHREESLIRVVVAEHQSKLSHFVKETAARSGLPTVPGDWIIDSLLNGSLFPLAAVVKASKAPKVSISRAKLVKRNVSTKRRTGIEGAESLAKSSTNSVLIPFEEVNMTEPCISFLGQGEAIPALCSMGLSFLLDIPKTSALGNLSCKAYHKSICINGIIYSAGDIVEVRPESGKYIDPYVAQIESFYAGHSRSVNTRSAKTGPKRGQPENPCFLCCRWFYRPSDTGFPCVGDGKELYLSQHFDDNAPVHSIIRKVQMVLLVSEKTYINDAERGWRNPTETPCTIQAADYICRYFYDYHKESLHQLKVAMIS